MVVLIQTSLLGQERELDSLVSTLRLPSGWNNNLLLNPIGTSDNNEMLVGKLTFTNKERKVVYMIYNKQVLNDSAFVKSENDRWLYSSCVNDFGLVHYVGAFRIEEFYFAAEPCPKCRFTNDKKCKKLAKYLHSRYKTYEIKKIPDHSFEDIQNIKISD